MTSELLPHVLDRDVFIRARRETVFRHFTDTPRWASNAHQQHHTD